jgi:site-specific DNA-methyltransferase (adenine-specific)
MWHDMSMPHPSIFKNATAEWSTPPALFKSLDRIFHFELDVCATPENAKCSLFFTKEQDGRKQDWRQLRCFCNPPYGRQIGPWVKKSWEASQAGALVVCLLPCRTDTVWFHDYVQYRAEIHFLRGRIIFGEAKHNAPFASMIAIYGKRDNRRLRSCQQCGNFFVARADAKTCSNACRQAAYRRVTNLELSVTATNKTFAAKF